MSGPTPSTPSPVRVRGRHRPEYRGATGERAHDLVRRLSAELLSTNHQIAAGSRP